MGLIRITKEFTFEMAHALFLYEGKCANIHGHSYHLSVTVIGMPMHTSDSNNGMVMDFGKLKDIVDSEIILPLDHALVLNEKDSRVLAFNEQSTKIVTVSYQPTCENLLLDFAKRLKGKIPLPSKLQCLKLRETATCYAEWFAEDNL